MVFFKALEKEIGKIWGFNFYRGHLPKWCQKFTVDIC